MANILIINPNTSAETAEAMQLACQTISVPGFVVHSIALQESRLFRAEKVFSYVDLAYATIETTRMAWKNKDVYDGILIAGLSDVAVDPLRELLSIPVIGIGEASYHMASLLGHRFSILTGTDKWSPPKDDTLARHGLTGRLASLRSYSEWNDSSDPEQVLDALEKTARRCIDDDQAEVVIIGAGPLVGYGNFLQNRINIPVIDPTLAGYVMLENCIRLGLSHSKLRKWRTPPSFISDSAGKFNYSRQWLEEP